MTRPALAFLVLAACSSPAAKTPEPHVQLAQRVVIVSIDGMMPDAYLDPDGHGLRVPTLRAMVANGAAARVRGVMPTVTYPSHTTMVTGVPPAVHGIVNNKPLDPLGKNFDGWRWYAEDIKVPTIYDAVEAAGGTSATVIWPVTVNAKAEIDVPEYWRSGSPDDQKLVRALSTPGVLEAVAAEYPTLWSALVPPDIKDDAQLAIARYLLRTAHPDLLLVHMFELDDAQHAHGPWSPEAKATLEAVDHRLATLLADLRASPDWARTTLFVVSDHGFAPITQELRPNVLFAKHGLLRADAADVAIIASGGTAFVYVLDKTKAADVDAAVAELPNVARRIAAPELATLGADPTASFALVAAPGFQFSDKRTGDPVMPTDTRGTHGWPPDDPAMQASLIAFGPKVKHAQLGMRDMTQLAPTVARLLGVPLPTATGTPIDELVR